MPLSRLDQLLCDSPMQRLPISCMLLGKPGHYEAGSPVQDLIRLEMLPDVSWTCWPAELMLHFMS